jgi:AcrR family transcriptional regulator
MIRSTRREKTTEARRKLIVSTAAACFVEMGFHQTSMRDVAKAAGISVANLYNHFKSKSALIENIAYSESAQNDALIVLLKEGGDPEKTLRKFVAAYLDICCEPGVPELTIEVISEGLRNPSMAARFIANRAQLVSALDTVVVRYSGVQTSSEHTVCQAEAIIDLVEGLSVRAAFDHRSIADKEKACLAQSALALAKL